MNMTKRGRLPAALLGVFCTIALVACGQGAGPGGIKGMLERLEPLVAECHGRINGYGSLDGSATGRGEKSLIDQRLRGIDQLADQVAACGGTMKVVLFGGRSEAEGATLGEAEFPTSSGTETARLIAANKVEEGLLTEVEQTLPAALKEVDPNGTNVMAQWELARQFAEQVPAGRLYVQLETDGIQTVPPVMMNTPGFTKAAAHKAAEEVAIPDLSGADVRIAGVGRTSGDRPPSTEKVEAMTAFYETACGRTGASTGLATTDYTTGG
jgi:hypothetical protein